MIRGFPGSTTGGKKKKTLANAGNVREVGSIPGQDNPLEESMATHSSILPGESHRQRSLVGSSP